MTLCLIDTIHSINKLNDNNNPNRLVLLGKNENEAIDNDYLHKTLIFSFLLAIQYGLQPILASAFTSRTISKTSVVIMTEFGKILIAIVGLATGLVVKSDDWSLQNSIQIAALPALLYAVQNVFVQYGYVLLDSMVFNVLNQCKTLSSAVFLFVFLGISQSIVQIVALILLLAAACMLSLKGQVIDVAFDSKNYKLGVILVTVASVLSGISTALTQKTLLSKIKGRKRDPVFFSAELATYGIIFLLISSLFQNDGYKMIENGFFNDWKLTTFIPVITNSFGGVIVGLVTKFGGGIVKGFALICGICVTAFAQWFIENKPLRYIDWIAVVLVSISIYLHSNYPPKKKIKL